MGDFRRKYDGDGWTITEYQYLKRYGELFETAVRADKFETAVRADKEGEDKVCRSFAPDGSYMGTVKYRSRPLYGLEKLYGDGKYRDHENIIIVKGEKCSEAAQKFFDNHIVVTYSGGAGSIDFTDWKPLQGKVVLILADNDQPGLNSALIVSDKLKKLRCATTVYSRHGDDKTDIADWIEDCETAEKRMDLRRTILDGAVDPSEIGTSGPDDQKTGGTAVEFLEFEPWPDEVSGSEVLSSLATVIEQFLYIKPEQADATALWCFMTWLHNHPKLGVAPFLNIRAPLRIGELSEDIV